MKATQILQGRREGELLTFPSVAHMTDILLERCREHSWVRTSVASLDRFRIMTGHDDLEALLARARTTSDVAEQALVDFATALKGYTDIQVSALAMGAKLWFRLNGVAVSWRPLPGRVTAPVLALSNQQETERVILLALIGSGLRMAELLRLRVGDIGSLDSEGRLLPDVEADPLAVQFTPRRGKQIERITFLTYQARQAILSSLAQRGAADHALDPDMPLLVQRRNGSSIAQARLRSRSLIEAGSNANVAVCRVTGDFFREWGLPGSRFEGPDDLNIEEFI
ncbi:MAG: hypothetical protein NVS2B12_14840 [Ktedonobacteraceae bacterium]